jgi:hypothetical protein
MNDERFIELLNLFLDHEITPANAKLLEAEVQFSPERRRIYREYCTMQKACVVLAESAATSATMPEFDIENSEFRGRAWGLGSWGLGAYAASFCAAAACLALALVIRNGNGSASSAPRVGDAAAVASVQIEPASGNQQLRREMPRTVSLIPRSAELQPVFIAQSLALTKQQRDALAPVSTDSRFEWMNRVQVTSLQQISADELLFDARALLQPDANTFRSRRPTEAQFEKAAFQFQR